MISNFYDFVFYSYHSFLEVGYILDVYDSWKKEALKSIRVSYFWNPSYLGFSFIYAGFTQYFDELLGIMILI